MRNSSWLCCPTARKPQRDRSTVLPVSDPHVSHRMRECTAVEGVAILAAAVAANNLHHSLAPTL